MYGTSTSDPQRDDSASSVVWAFVRLRCRCCMRNSQINRRNPVPTLGDALLKLVAIALQVAGYPGGLILTS